MTVSGRMQDDIVEEILLAIRAEKVDSSEKVRALRRAGKIADAHFGAPSVLLESAIGCDDALQDDLRSHILTDQHGR